MTTANPAAPTMQQLSQAVFDRAVALAKHRARCLELAKSPWCHNKQMMLDMAAHAEAEIAHEAQLADWYAAYPQPVSPAQTVAATLVCTLVELAQAKLQNQASTTPASVALHLPLQPGQAQQLADTLMAAHQCKARRMKALQALFANMSQLEWMPAGVNQPPAQATAHAPAWPGEEPVLHTLPFEQCVPFAVRPVHPAAPAGHQPVGLS